MVELLNRSYDVAHASFLKKIVYHGRSIPNLEPETKKLAPYLKTRT